jgi:hypothetical protein
MDISKLSNGDKVLAGSGILLFIFSFLTWFKKDYGALGYHVTYKQNGWDYFGTGTIPVIIALLLIAYVVVTKLLDNVTLPELPIAYNLLVLGLGVLVAVLIILRLLLGASYSGIDVDLDRSIGLFLSVIAGIGVAGGSFLKFQEEGGDLSNLKGGGKSDGGTTGDSGSATPF